MAPKALDVELGAITPANVQQLKVINEDTLPVRYSEKFYRDIVVQDVDKKILKFAFHNFFAVGAVCARIEPHETSPDCSKLYIMTINVLGAYRRRGIASTLLKHVLEEASKTPNIIEVYLHVQTSNEDARSFYLSNGFVQTDLVENYYRNIEPPHSFLLKKSLREGHVVASTLSEANNGESIEQKEEISSI